MYYLVKTTKKWQIMSNAYLARKLSLNGRTNVSVKAKLVYAIPQEDKKSACNILSKIETLPGECFLSVVGGETYEPICCWFIRRYQEFYGVLKMHFEEAYLESVIAMALKNDFHSLKKEMKRIKKNLVRVAKIDVSSPVFLSFMAVLCSKHYA